MVNVYTWLKGQWKSLSLAFVATLLSTLTLQANCCFVALPSLSEDGGCAVMSNIPVGQCGDPVEWMWARNNNGSIQGMTPFSTNQVTTYCPEESGLYRLCLRVVGCSTIYETSDVYVEAAECNGSITGLFIYDQNTDAPVAGLPALTNGGIVNLSQLPAHFYIAAETNGNIESVVLSLNGNSNTENHAPYTLPGGGESGNNLSLSPGTYTLSVAAFSQDQGYGEQCDYTSVTFTVASDTCVSIENGTSPYSIDDPVFQEVISNDPYCCNTAWDVICEDQYTEINTTGTLIETCVLDGYQFPGGRIFWLPNFGTDFKATASGLFLDKFDDGTARIYGEVARIADSNKKFKVSVWYNNFSTYSEWIAQGLQAKSPELGDETTWVFYSLDQSKVSTLIGLNSYAGEVLYIQQQNNPYGLQIGDGANDLNANPNGLSMWFDYNGTSSGHGDINATYDCGDEIEPSVDTFELDCDDALRVAIQGIGLEGQQCASLNVDPSLPGDVEYMILETVWKGSNPPATITFTADGNDYIAEAQVVLEGNGNDQGNKRAYRAEVPAASTVGVCRPAGFNNNLRSFVAYVFRSNAGSISAGSGEFVGRHLYLSSYTMTLTVPAAPEARDIVVTLPLSDMSDDGRNADFHLTAGPVQKNYSVNGNTNGLSLNITPFVLENVPGDVTEVEIELISDPNNNPSSFLAAGLAIADAQCDTPEEEQICEVVGFNGPGTRHFIFFNAYGTNYTSNDEGLQFIQYVDGTAKMTGTIFAVNNPNKQFEVVLYFNNKSNYDEFTAAGFAPKIPSFASTADAETWTYYSFDQSRPNVLTGRGQNEGVYLFLRNQDGTNHGLQIGSNGANDKNNEFGLSTWFSYSGSSNGNGDINANLLCEIPECTVECPSDLDLDCTASTDPEFTGYPTLSCTDNNACAREAGEFDFEFQGWGGSTEGWSFGPGWQVGDGCAPSCGSFPNVFIDYSNFHSPYNTKLKSPVYDACCTDEVYVSFCMQQDLFGSSSEPGFIDVQYRVNGGNWHTVASYESIHGATINYNDTYLLPEAAGQNFEVRFKAYGNGSSGYTMGGWGLDNVRIFGQTAGCTPTTGEVEITWDFSDEVVGSCPTIITRTFTATFNNEDFTCVQTLTVSDEEAPIFIQTPEDAEYLCFADVVDSGVTAIDNCDNDVQVNMVESIEGDDCHATITRTFTATDDCDNVATFTQTIVVNDDLAPVIDCPADAQVNCNGGSLDPSETGVAVASDNCSEVEVTFEDGPITGDCPSSFERTWTASDACGNSSVCVQIISIIDSSDPIINCPENITIDCTSATTPDVTGMATATDDCSEPTITYVDGPVTGVCPSSFERIFTATDACGNASSSAQIITIVDTEAPVISGEDGESTFECDVMPTLIAPTVTDNCDDSVELVLESEVIPGDCPNERTEVYVWTATDLCGNTSVRTITWNFVDTTAPVFDSTPEDLTIDCSDDLPMATLTATDNCDDDVLVLVTINEEILDCGSVVTRTFTAVDACGNEASISQTINKVDTTAPVIECPEDYVVNCDNGSSDPADAGMATATDDCSSVEITFVDGPVSGDCPSSFERTWTATDACGNSDSCVQLITINDFSSPIIDCPEDITIDCTSATTPDVTGMATATDDCSEPVITYVDGPVTGDCPFTFDRIFTATDACGNESSSIQVITIIDTEAPLISGEDMEETFECDMMPELIEPTVTDNCDENLEVVLSSEVLPGDCANERTEVYTWTATDACGNTSSRTITWNFVDTTAPVLGGIPADMTIECDEEVPNVNVFAIDNCDVNPMISLTAETQPLDCGYELIRTWTAVDVCGNSSQASQVVTVIDTTAPTATFVPQSVTIECDEEEPSEQPIFTDNCDDELEIFAISGINNVSDCGFTIERSWTAVDDCGNATTVTQTIVVVDTTAPEISNAPEDVTVDCSEIPAPAELTATDNCDDNPVVTFNEEMTSGCPYQLIRTWTATDACGNTSFATQVITVIDTEAPILVGVPDDVSGECGTVPSNVQVTATDNCDDNVPVTFSEEVIGESCPLTVVRTWTAVDNCGNSVSASQTIEINDVTAPVFTQTPDASLTLECDNVSSASVNDVVVEDNCDLNPSVVLSETIIPGLVLEEGLEPCGYSIERVWTATDLCGNESSFTQVVTVVDTTAPVLIGVPADTTAECDDLPAAPMVSAIDNCFNGEMEVSLSESIVDLDCGYQLIRTWTASDNCLNQVVASQIITVVDTTAPVVISTPADEVVECDEELPTGTAQFEDNCDDMLNVTLAETIVDQACGFQLIRTWTATDDCGNSVSTSQTISVVDTTNPVLVGVPVDATVECSAIPAPANVSATDNCDDDVMVAFSETVNAGDCPYTIVRTWTATDDCGNVDSVSQTLTVVDTEAPVLIGVPANIETDCNNIPAVAVVSATDNCAENLVPAFTQTMEALEDCGYSITRTWSVSDDCGNTAMESQVIFVIDTEVPTLVSGPQDLSLSCDEDVPFEAPVFADDCDEQLEVALTETVNPGSCENNFTIVRTWVASDDCGNSTSYTQNITVSDTSAPVLVDVPADAEVECDAIPAVASVSAVDNCDLEVTVSFSESIEVLECGKIITRTWTATDNCGNNSSESQTLTVVDTTAPMLVFEPQDITISCDEDEPIATPIFDDNCDDDLTVIATSSITMLDCGFQINRVWTAMDDCGNSTSATQTITVVDTEDPVLIDVPANASVECDAIPAPANVSAVDNCDTDLDLNFSEELIGDGCPYQIIRTWTVTDECGNSSTASQTLTVIDSTLPVLVGVPADAEVECDAIPSVATVSATDNCSTNLIVEFTESEELLDCGSVITRTWSVVDDCNNYTSASQILTVIDSTAPVLIGVPADDTVECDAVPAIAQVGASDNCSLDLEVFFNEAVEVLDCGYILTRTWSVTDACGNTTSESQTLTVVDTTVPVIVNAPADLSVDCDAVPGPGMLEVTDNCDPMPEVVVSEEINQLDCGFELLRTYTVTDNCGNQATHVQSITVQDTTAPEITGVPVDITIDCGDPVPAPGQVNVEDNCDPMPVVSVTEVTELLDCGSQIIRTYTASDECGNIAEEIQVITITDTEAPIFDTMVEDITVNCEDLTIAPTVTASDNCSANVVVTLEEIQGEGCPYTIQRTWTAVDGCGNEATMTQIVTVIDEVAPVFDEHDFFISLSCELVDDYILTASDNCDADVTVEIIQELTFSGGCLGVLERTYQATDDCGNVTTTTQLIQQVDNVAPELFNVPESVTIDCEDEVPAVANDVFATDNCTEDVNLSFTEIQTNEFCPYEIIRTWTAVDQCGNVTEGVQVITVTVETPLQVTLLTYPNPMDDRFTLEFSVPRDAQVIARVYDMTGREVLHVFEGKADARRQYDLFFEGLDWKAGAYILMMTVDEKVYNHRIIVTQN